MPLRPPFSLVLLAVLLSLLLQPGVAQAQAPPWALATAGTALPTGSEAVVRATATDASGNVLVAGYFEGQATFGSVVLTSAGHSDFFLAKYAPGTGTWVWAVRGGGADYDRAYGVAVSGSSIYITGYLTNNTGNAYAVTFQQSSTSAAAVAVAGATPMPSADLLVTKYVDSGPAATLTWTQLAGGTNSDEGYGIAASGSSLYVTGVIANTINNATAVVFGGTGSSLGTLPQYGASAQASYDLVLAKYVDNGLSASVAWTQVAGGTANDFGQGVAVSGTSVYVVGSIFNDRLHAQGVVFGGAGRAAGTLAQYGTSTQAGYDLVLAKYNDLGTSASVAWTQVAGGSGNDYGQAVAASGSSVYVTGSLINTTTNTQAVVFGGSGAVLGTLPQYGATTANAPDLVLAKYVDNGTSASVAWTQVAGGTGTDGGQALAVRNSRVFVAGTCYANQGNAPGVLFGGAGTAPGTVPVAGAGLTPSADAVVAYYLDNGPTATFQWAQAGGGTSTDGAYALALGSTALYAGGTATPPATFAPLALAAPAGSTAAFLVALDLATLLPAVPATSQAAFHLAPSPTGAGAAAWLTGAAPGAAGQVLDALGRAVTTFVTDGNGATRLLAPLVPGVYLVRVGATVERWAVE